MRIRLRACPFLPVIWMVWLAGMTGMAQEGGDESRYREVIVRVVNEQGAPMSGVTVHLVGTERDAEAGSFDQLQSEPDKNAPDFGAWRFVSDAQGRFVARFWCFEAPWDVKPGQKRLPGWGYFFFVAEADGLRGVSSSVVHESRREPLGEYEKDEWTRTNVVKTRSRPVHITLQMQQGVRVEGRVIDRMGQPVSNYLVRTFHDLHAATHTGYGGEIFQQEVLSGADGRFSLERIFPNTFYIHASPEVAVFPVWIRTEIRGQWFPEAVDAITPRRSEKVIHVNLLVSPKLVSRYHGRVTDASGRPVVGAKVVLGMSSHPFPQTWGDDHSYVDTTTDENGRYEMMTRTPFLRFLQVTAAGFEVVDVDYEEGRARLRAPGRLDIKIGSR